ncbi:MAG: PQQ-binding-like beta-propeller repeat protein [Nitriliruptorales bacterium]|nr:PQQ-binding-like beta-propeller repeat protein [Nitriliruptorales bacterium]
MSSRIVLVVALVAAAAALVGGAAFLAQSVDDPADRPVTLPTFGEPTPPVLPTPTPSLAPGGPLGEPWGLPNGLRQFRGNPEHTWYGRGPLPAAPSIAWSFPDRPMCSTTTQSDGTTKRWCGTGWTGQPLVHELDGRTEVIFNSYDGRVYFLDADSGEPTRPPFVTGEMVKGTWTLDPDGFPLLYGGSRDNFYRIVDIAHPDGPTELWRMGPHPQGQWNNDWDGNGSIVDDVLYVGGEDSFFYVIRLNRSAAPGGVSVAPEVLVATPTFNDEYAALTGDRQTSVESSPVVTEDAVYVANSAGRVVGWDRGGLLRGEVEIVFDWWAGDDVDASLVHDDGILYVGVEWDRKLDRGREVGQLLALDTSRPDDPWLWGIDLWSERTMRPELPSNVDGGVWATPALYGDHLYVTTHRGALLVVDKRGGKITHEEQIGFHEWSSPVVVESDGRGPELLVALCEAGGLRAYSLEDPARPRQTWQLQLPTGACIESTPAVWDGRILVGSRDGYFYGIR